MLAESKAWLESENNAAETVDTIIAQMYTFLSGHRHLREFSADCAKTALERERKAGRKPRWIFRIAVKAARAYARCELSEKNREAVSASTAFELFALLRDAHDPVSWAIYSAAAAAHATTLPANNAAASWAAIHSAAASAYGVADDRLSVWNVERARQREELKRRLVELEHNAPDDVHGRKCRVCGDAPAAEDERTS